jgi:hypothetical protein
MTRQGKLVLSQLMRSRTMQVKGLEAALVEPIPAAERRLFEAMHSACVQELEAIRIFLGDDGTTSTTTGQALA